jgi:hypothetical protein
VLHPTPRIAECELQIITHHEEKPGLTAPSENGGKHMRKFIISALAAASILGAVSVAYAGYWLANGISVPTCGWYFNDFAWVYGCG